MNYEIVRSKRKTLTIQVHRDHRIEVRAPLRCKDKDIALFFSKHRQWIDKKLQQSYQYPGLSESLYCHGEAVWLLGESILITVNRGVKSCVKLVNNQLIVEQSDIGNLDLTQRLITQWKRDFAANLFQQQLAFWAIKFPGSLKNYQFRLRKMKRQWGNCNSHGMITINSQLIRYPLTCIDYVMVHELTHLKHLHHGRAFYQLLEQVMPDWRQHKILLSQFSGSIQTTE